MKFKNLNEAQDAEKFAKNIRTRNFDRAKDFEYKNFAEAEGGDKAMARIEREIGYALEGKDTIISVVMSLLQSKESAEKEANYIKDEFKRDSAIGYAKTIGAFVGKNVRKDDLWSVKYRK